MHYGQSHPYRSISYGVSDFRPWRAGRQNSPPWFTRIGAVSATGDLKVSAYRLCSAKARSDAAGEKPQIQALDRTAPLLPLRPGQAERRTHVQTARDDVALCRTGSEDGTRAGSDSSAASRDRVSRLLDRPRCLPADLDVHVIMDNYGTHKTALIRRWFARHPRFHPHFTPTYASWLNLVERWFAALETKQLRRGVHDSVRSLESAIREFIDASNTVGQPYVWTKTADDILASHDRQLMSRTTGRRRGSPAARCRSTASTRPSGRRCPSSAQGETRTGAHAWTARGTPRRSSRRSRRRSAR